MCLQEFHGQAALILGQQALNVASQQINLDIDHSTDRIIADDRSLGCMRDDIQVECISGYFIYGKTDAVHAHRAFSRDVARKLCGYFHSQLNRARIVTDANDRADAINMTTDQVATKSITQAQRWLEVDEADGHARKRCPRGLFA